MTSSPMISILTPVWNGLPFLKECVESVLVQEFQNWELLISDNVSSDGTCEYLDNLTDPRIRIFKQKKNLGIMGNVNFLFSQAKAPLSQILCADDYFINANSLVQIMNYWETALPDIGFVSFNHADKSINRIIDLEGKITPEVIYSDQSDLWFFIFGNIPGNLSNVSVRTHLVSKIGNFNENLPFAGDFEFWSRAARSVSMGIQNKLVICVRRHDKVASNYLSLKGELYLQHITIYEKLIEELSSTYDRKKLVDYFNYEVCSFHFRNAFKSALNGRFSYLNNLIHTRSSILWPKWQQLIYCTSFAFLNNHQKHTYYMAKKILKNQLQQPKHSELQLKFLNQ